ncbi:hypothetical protein ABWED_0663 [Acinetobacter lwoffii]|nr:hypothetical protein ABWED_0663 [Acinetobacter lwoffii]
MQLILGELAGIASVNLGEIAGKGLGISSLFKLELFKE